jgi:hypothetical protein
MLNVRHIFLLCRIIHHWYYLSALKFNDLHDLLACYEWLKIIIKEDAPPCNRNFEKIGGTAFLAKGVRGPSLNLTYDPLRCGVAAWNDV